MKIAIVTGASSGIGREFVLQLEKEGLDEIWVIARREERLRQLQKEVKTKLCILALDLTNPVSFDRYRKELEEKKPEVQWLINASGYGKFGYYDELSVAEGRHMIELNVQALVELTVCTLPFVKRGGHVLQMASVASFQPLPNFNLYAAGKAFVRSYSRGLREEVRPLGITVTAVCPGWVETEFMEHTDQGKTRVTLKAFRPILPAQRVVAQALRDGRNNRPLSVCGLYNKMQHVLSKVLPNQMLLAAWNGMQEKTK